jgi:Methyltransferase domain
MSVQASDRSVPLSGDLRAEIEGWYRGATFAYDWTSPHFPSWTAVLGERHRPLRILEIGSYEGRSAIFFLNYFPASTLTCVDWWNMDTNELELLPLMPDALEHFAHAEERFDTNLAPYGNRATKLKGNSADVVAQLGVDGSRFDLIYVDGGHRAMWAYRDCTLSWPLLEPDGIMIMDDYAWPVPLAEWKKPKLGIDRFLSSIGGGYQELHRAYQLIIRKSRL